MILVGRPHPPHGGMNLRGDCVARFHGRTLRQIEEHSRQRIVTRIQRNATHQIGTVLAVGQPARCLAGCTPRRKHPHRTSARLAFAECIGVDRNEQIRFCLAGLLVACVERDEEIAVAGQHRTHTGFLVDDTLEFTCDREGDDFFVGSGCADRTRIVTAVASVDHDDDVPRCARWNDLCDGLDCFRLSLWIQIENQPISELLRGWQEKTLRSHTFAEIKDDTKILGSLFSAAHGLEQALGLGDFVVGGERARLEIENQPIWPVQVKQLVVKRARDVENRTRVFRPRPDSQGLDFSRVRRSPQSRQHQQRGKKSIHRRRMTIHGCAFKRR